MTSALNEDITLWSIGPPALHVAGNGGQIVSDAGLLAVRALDKALHVIGGLAERLPDPRSRKYSEHSAEAILLQELYQILAGYPDCNDAPTLRHDPLCQILAEVSPDADNPLARGSTWARFQYAFPRRQAALPREERPVRLEVRAAQTGRIKILNDYLVDWLLRTRRTPPVEIILDRDATDDPVHGQQTLSGQHGYYRQHQYLPLLVYDGAPGFPLAAWRRPGTVPASLAVVELLDRIITRWRAAWPGGRLRVRSDNGLAVPRLYTQCESPGLLYALGYASNAVLLRMTEQALADLALDHAGYQHREPCVQRFASLANYPAEGWPPRRIVAKIEVTPQGSQRRLVVANLEDPPAVVYRDFYVQRGRVPAQPVGERQNGLQADRLSACGFCANAFRLLVHTLADAIVVLFREAVAAVPEIATATGSTRRQRVWKVAAVVVTRAWRIGWHLSEPWPNWGLWRRVLAAVNGFVHQIAGGHSVVPERAGALPM